MARKYKNNASSTLAGALTVSATTLTVATGQGDRFPIASGSDYFVLTLQKSGGTEIVKVTSRVASSDSMTILRAQEGTPALSFSIGDIVSLRATADSYNSIDAHVESTTAHSASAIVNIPAGGISSTNVQAALNELDSDKEVAGAVAAHVAATDPHPQYLTTAKLSTAYQPTNVNLTAESNLTGAANKLSYYTGVGAKALTDLSPFSRTLLANTDAPTARTTLGAQATLVSGTSIKTISGQSLLGSGDIAISAIGRLSNIVHITTAGSGTYTKPSNVNFLLIRAIGGGGGGVSSSSGNGGGSGGYGELFITSPASSYSYTVGAGGTAGANGGATTIAGITAGGGSGGSNGGTGGSSSGGSINVRGGCGALSTYNNDSLGTAANFPGCGGDGVFGGGGQGSLTAANASGVFGGGGGGGPTGGGTGGTGYIQIWEFQ
jgi:hypothetical protein